MVGIIAYESRQHDPSKHQFKNIKKFLIMLNSINCYLMQEHKINDMASHRRYTLTLELCYS